MKKLIIFSIFSLSQAAMALQAPFLYTADSVADTAIQLTWRNNSVDYQGIIILRKTTAAGAYSTIDTALGTATSFVDIVKPPSQVTYYYALTAYSLTEHADTSNVDSARITPVPFDSIFVAPQDFRVTWIEISNYVSIDFWDTSNVKPGYRIYRSMNFGSFIMIKDLTSSTPSPTGHVGYADSTVSPNTWYTYYVVAYKGQQTFSTVTDTVFTFDVNAMKRNSPRKCTLLDKIGSFPINYGTWSLKSGDTIVLNESSAPESVFSIIDVSIPSQPKFAGLGKSGAAVIFYYPTKRALYAYTKGDYVFKPTGDSLSCYKYHSGTMQNLSTINVGRTVLPPCGFLSDTVLIVPNLIDTINYFYGAGVSYLWAGEFLFKNKNLSYSKEELVYNQRCGTQLPCDYSYSPALASGVLYQGRLFIGIPGYDGEIQTMEVFDFNYPIPCKKVFAIDYTALPFFDIQLLSNGISLDATSLAADSLWIHSNSHAILIDTVKNLVFALSDSELSIYNCQIVTGISHAVPPLANAGQVLHIGKGKNDFASLIFLPHHTQPCAVSIFDVSGRRIARMEGIRGETVAWPHQNRAGVYIVRAVLDGSAVTAKVVLSK